MFQEFSIGDDAGQTTIESRDPFVQNSMGQRLELSFYDVKLANKAYCNGTFSSILLIETGRYNNIERNNRDMIDCVYFLSKSRLNLNAMFYLCARGKLRYIDIRIQLLPTYYTCLPFKHKLISVRKNECKKVQIKLAAFNEEAFIIRKWWIEKKRR